jgi:hypothetical protein
MRFKPPVLALFLVFAFSAGTTAQPEQRIIRADRPEYSEDALPILEVQSLKIGGRAVSLNEAFIGDENWLKDLKITVKNVSEKDLRCVGVWMGVLEGLDTKLEPYASWGWKINYTNGQCGNSKASNSVLRKGESVDLTCYVDRFFERTPWSTFHKAVLNYGYVKYKGDKKKAWHRDTPLTLPPNTNFLSDDSY